MRLPALGVTALLVAGLAAAGASALRWSGDSVAAPTESVRPPVIMLVFDEWPVDAMLGPAGRIDAGRYPNIAALARTATWYPNATTVYDTTFHSVPAILDGQMPRPGPAPTFRTHPRSIFSLLGRRGYRIVREEPITAMCPPRWCRSPVRTPPGVGPTLRTDRARTEARFFERVRARPGHLYFRHALLPHGPYLYLPSGQRMRPSRRDPIPKMGTGAGFGETHLAWHKGQRLRLQIGLVDRQLGKLFRRLRRQGTFDDALIVMTADHGISSEVGVQDRRVATPANVHEIAPVPLFIKAPDQRLRRADPTPITTIDIVPTVAEILGLRYRADGRPASSPATRRRRTVRVIARDFVRTVTVSAAGLARRRAAQRRRDARAFGFGDWASLYRGPGRYNGLIGRGLSELAAIPSTSPLGKLANLAALRDVRHGSRVLPTQIAGSVAGGAPDQRRDYVVAVNGKIRAAGRTFRLRGDPGEHFAAMVPERSLRAGPNAVAVYEVLGGASRLRLLAATPPA